MPNLQNVAPGSTVNVSVYLNMDAGDDPITMTAISTDIAYNKSVFDVLSAYDATWEMNLAVLTKGALLTDWDLYGAQSDQADGLRVVGNRTDLGSHDF